MSGPARNVWLSLLSALSIGAAFDASAASTAVVERIRYIGTVSYSRVVVDLSAPVEYHMVAVTPDGKAGPADRLVIDVSGAKIGPEAREPLEIGDAMLRAVRTGQYTLETARIVLDLAGEADARAFVLPDPYRLIIDLKGKAAATGGAAAIRRLDSARPASPSEGRGVAAAERPRPATMPPTASPPTAPHRLKVVIDPGHGGKDPGAQGVRGIDEKDVVLEISKLLAARLGADPGIEVAMTRSDDRYLSLEERTGFANAQAADLFVSVHGNASVNPGLRGVEVYYLNNTDNRGTLRLAAMENNLHWDPHDPKLQAAIPDLSYILSDLRQTYKVEESRQLAEQLEQSVVSRLSNDYDAIEDLGAKEGPFYVLVGAYMPCVLVEVSFLTNPVEGARLSTREYRKALADGLYEGIHRYLLQTKLAKTL